MQVGRAYKLILVVIVIAVFAVVLMWVRSDEEEAPTVAENSPAAEEALIPLTPEDTVNVSDQPSNKLPVEVSGNPFFPTTPAPTPTVDPSKMLVPLVTPADKTGNMTSNPEEEASNVEKNIPKQNKRYVVQSGDNLESISKKFYGKRSLWKKIADANKMENPAALQVGMELTIPDVEESAPAVAKNDNAPVAKDGKTTYKVQRGDNLESIAAKFYGKRTLWKKIADANNITNPSSLKIGQELVIPDAPANPPAPKIATGDSSVKPDSKPNDDKPAATIAEGEIYTVVNGDSLWKIAKKVYGDGEKWRGIYDANRKVLPTPDALKVGMKLIIPPAGSSKPEEKHPVPVGNAAGEKAGIAATTPDMVEVHNFVEN